MINYHKNFKTNETIEVYKNKENHPIKGSAKILLMEDDKVVEEVFTENVITNEAIEIMLYNAMKNVNSMDSNCVNLSAFGSLYLVNYSGAVEDSKLKAIPFRDKDVIGYANAMKEVASIDPKVGTINNTLTNFNVESGEMNLFFSFTYDKALGSFNSLYWGAGHEHPSYDINTALHFAPKPIERVETINVTTNTLVSDNRGYIYALQGGYSYRCIFYVTGNVKKLAKMDEGKPLNHNDTISCAVFNPTTSNFWVFTDTGWLYKYDINFNFLEKVTKPTYMDTSSYDNYRTAFLGTKMYYVNYDKTIIIGDYNGTKTSENTTLLADIDRIIHVFADTKYLYIVHSIRNTYDMQCISVYDQDLNLICRNATPINGYSDRGFIYTFGTPMDGCFISLKNDGSLGYLHKAIDSVSAVTKLPGTGVTKGTANSMLVQYQFKFK